MLDSKHYVVIAKLKPKEGAIEKLLSLRGGMIAEFKANNPNFVSASLFGVYEGDEWRDVVVYSENPPLDSPTNAPFYEEWSKLVEFIDYELLEPLSK